MIRYLKEAVEDIKKLSKEDRKLLDELIVKLEKNIYLGKPLMSNLSDCRKLYFGKTSELRIVYTIRGNEVCIIVAVGNRSDLEVYRLSAARLDRKWH